MDIVMILKRTKKELVKKIITSVIIQGLLLVIPVYWTNSINHATNQEYDKALYDILDTYTENSWEDEPLDGDEVDRLTEFLRAKLNLINGNITQEEYNKILG